MIFRPHVTVACLVSAGEKFLVVEETVNGKATWNQPAGHLEARKPCLPPQSASCMKKPGSMLLPMPC